MNRPSKTPDPASLRNRALAYLARREHSRAELVTKLVRAGFDEADVAPLLDEFQRQNWLSDQRYAESYIADHRAKAGNIKLVYALRQRGVAEDIIEAAMNDRSEDELARARTIWHKKYPAPPADLAETARHTRFLQSRGFSLTVIRQVLKQSLSE